MVRLFSPQADSCKGQMTSSEMLAPLFRGACHEAGAPGRADSGVVGEHRLLIVRGRLAAVMTRERSVPSATTATGHRPAATDIPSSSMSRSG